MQHKKGGACLEKRMKHKKILRIFCAMIFMFYMIFTICDKVYADETTSDVKEEGRTEFAIDYDPNEGKIHYGHSGDVGMRAENDINNSYEKDSNVVYFPDDVMNDLDENGNPKFPDYDPKDPYYDYTDMLNEALSKARKLNNADVFVKEGVYYFTKSIYLFGYTNINAEAGKTAFVIKPNFQDKDGNPVDANGFFTNGDLSATYSWYFGKISDIAFAVEGTHDSFKPTSSAKTIISNLCSDDVNAIDDFSLFYRVRIKYGAIDNIGVSGFYAFLRWCFMDMLTRVTNVTVGPTRLVYFGVETNDAFFYDSYYYGGYFTQDDLHEIPIFQINFSMGTTVFSNSYLENYFFSRSGAGTWCPHTTYSNLTLKRVCNFVIDTTVVSSSVSGCLFKDCAYNDIEAYFQNQGLEPYDHETRYYDHEQKKWMYPGTGYVIRDNIVGDSAYDRKHSANHWNGQMLTMIELHSGIAFTQNKIECDSLDWTTLVRITDSEWSARYSGQRGSNNIHFSDNAFQINEWKYKDLMIDDWRTGRPYTEEWSDNTIIVWGENGKMNSDGTPEMGWVSAQSENPVCWLKDGIYVSVDLERYIDLSAFLNKDKQGFGYAALGDVGADEQGLWDAGLEDRYYKDMQSKKYEIVSFEDDFDGMGWNTGSNHEKLQKAFDYVATHDAILRIEKGTYYTNKPIVLRGGKTYRVVFEGTIKSHKTQDMNGAGIFVMSADDNEPINGYFINTDLYMQNCNTSGFYNVNTDNFYMKVGTIARGVGAFTNCKLKNTVIHEGQIQYCDYGFFYKTVTDNILVKNVYGTASTWVETEDAISPGDMNYRYFISSSDFKKSTWRGCWLEFGQFSNGKTLTGAGNSLYRGNIIDYTYNYSFGRNDVVCGNTLTRANYGSIVNHMENSNFSIDKPDILTDKPMIMFHVSDGLRLIGNTDLGSMNHDTHFIEFDSPGISYQDSDGNVVKSISNARVAGNVVYTENKGEYKQKIPITPFGKADNIISENCKNNQFELQYWYLVNQADNPETEEEEITFTIQEEDVRSWSIPGVKTYVNGEYVEVAELNVPEKELEQIEILQPAQEKIYDVPNKWLSETKQTAYLLYDFKGRTVEEAQVLAQKMEGYIDDSTIVPYVHSQYNVAQFGEEERNYSYADIKDLTKEERYNILSQTIQYGLSQEEDFGNAFLMDGSREIVDLEGTTNNVNNANKPTYAIVFKDEMIPDDNLLSVNTSFYYDYKLSHAWQGKRPTFIILSEDDANYYGVVIGYSCKNDDNGIFAASCYFEKDYFNKLVDGRAEKNNNFPQAHFENGIFYESGKVNRLTHIDPLSKITRPYNGEQQKSVLGDYTQIPMFDGNSLNYESVVLGVDLSCEYDDAYGTVSLYANFDFSRIGEDTSHTPSLKASTRKVWIGTYDIEGDNKVFGIWNGDKTWLQSVQFEYVPDEVSACEHTFSDKVTRQVTCNKEGVVRHTCDACGYEYEEKVKVTGHKFWDKEHEDGATLRSCSVCKLSFVTTEPAKYKCEHQYEDKVIQQENCEQDGAVTHICSICEEQYTDVIPALGHQYQEKVIAPTYTEEGYTLYTCRVCNHTYKDNYTPILVDDSVDENGNSKSDVLLGKNFKDKKGNRYKIISVRKKMVAYVKPKNKKVKDITIPASVKYKGVIFKVSEISDKAFYKCTKLKKIIIGKNVVRIGKKAFYGCKKLRKIYIKTSKLKSKSVGKSAFSKTYARAKVKVPKKKVKAYKKFLKKKGLHKKASITK